MSDQPKPYPKNLQVQLSPELQVMLEDQATAVGLPTRNTWASMVLQAIAPLEAPVALKLLGKMQELKTSRRRISDL